VADWHALTTHYEDTSSIAENTLQVAIDWLSVGIDPAKATVFVQSRVLEHAELHLLLSMITPLGWLERVPTYKEQIENLKDRDLGTYGFLGYPLLQSADIVMYGEPRIELLVPVGEDQVPHVELTREVVRRFDTQYGFQTQDALFEDAEALARATARLPASASELLRGDPPSEPKSAYSAMFRKRAAEIGVDNFLEEMAGDKRYFRLEQVLREPDHLLTETPRLPGTDGRRMAKSYGNAIWLSDPPEIIREKSRNMMTDPRRVRRTDPGCPEVCPVFAYHKLFSGQQVVAWAEQGCRSAGIGCVDCKKAMTENLLKWIEPVQSRRRDLEEHPGQVWDILDAGGRTARAVAKRTMKRVRNSIFGSDAAEKMRGR
jgi:tryptophanyl-tRNA synthetase